MRKAPGITLAELHNRQVFDKAWNLLKQDKLRNKIYAREGAAAERFKDAVNEANPDELYIDIRLNNSSQLAGFTKQDDLAFFLEELCDAEYEHKPTDHPQSRL